MINEIYLHEGKYLQVARSRVTHQTLIVNIQRWVNARARKIDDMQNWFLYGEQDYTAIQTRF